jgi:hypothetical protein
MTGPRQFGRMMERKMRRREHPSMRAASSSSRGISPMEFFSTRVGNAAMLPTTGTSETGSDSGVPAT